MFRKLVMVFRWWLQFFSSVLTPVTFKSVLRTNKALLWNPSVHKEHNLTTMLARLLYHCYKILTQTIEGENYLLWLTVSEGSVHGSLALCFWACDEAAQHGSGSMWGGGCLLMVDRKQREQLTYGRQEAEQNHHRETPRQDVAPRAHPLPVSSSGAPPPALYHLAITPPCYQSNQRLSIYEMGALMIQSSLEMPSQTHPEIAYLSLKWFSTQSTWQSKSTLTTTTFLGEDGIEVWPQGFLLAIQALYQLSYTSSPFCSGSLTFKGCPPNLRLPSN
jgi:hypothetical protein